MNPAPAHHALVIGGTGMLAGVTCALARRMAVSVVARSHAGFDSMRAACGADAPAMEFFPTDYHDARRLMSALDVAAGLRGPAELIVSWIHSTAPDAPHVIARHADSFGVPCRFVDVLGSRFATGDARLERARRFAGYRWLRYVAAVLGYVKAPGGSRWLTHGEIAEGVLAAIAGDAAEHIVGRVEPWADRP